MTQTNNSMPVSFFTGIRSKNPVTIPVSEFMADIRNGRWKLQTQNYRLVKSEGHEKEATRLKATMPAICVACLCQGGHQEKNIVQLTGLVPIDLDHTGQHTQEVFLKATRLPYVAAAFISISGEGVKVIVRTEVPDRDNYPEVFGRVARRIFAETGATVDPSGKNVNRLCFASYHPEAYYNPEATPMPVTPTDETLFHSAVKTLNKKEMYVKGNRNNYIYKLLQILRRRKMTEADAQHWCARYFELDAEELSAIVKSVYKASVRQAKEKEIDQRHANAERNRQENISLIEEFIKERYELRYNIVTKQVEVRSKPHGGTFEPMTDYEENSILLSLLQHGHKITGQLLHSILNSNLAKQFDPFADYFEHLPAWDGKTDYIGALAATVTTTQPEHWESCFRKWLVAMVAGWLKPEVVNHTVLALIGAQGIYKTTWSLRLMPPELERYRFTGAVDSHTRDGQFTLSQCGLVNFEEIENMDRKDLNKFKALVTQSVINERAFYGKNKEYLIRRASIIGSGNNKDILTDMTGNRRWLCFEVTDIQAPEEFEMPYEGIYAQAKAMMESGFRHWFDRDEMLELSKRNEEFTLRSVEEEQLAVWFRKPEPGEACTLMTASQVMGKMAQWVHMPLNKVRVGRALKAAGYERKVLHGNIKAYKVIERIYMDVKQQGQD